MNAKNRETLLLLVAGLTLGGLVFDRMILTPAIAYYQETAEEIKLLEENMMKGKILIDRERILRRTWAEMQRDDLPKNVSEAENMVLKPFDSWITDSRLELLSFKLQWNEVDEEYNTLECFAVAQGSLEQITRFLYLLETDPLPLNIENLELSDLTGNGDQLRLNLRFSGIRLLEELS